MDDSLFRRNCPGCSSSILTTGWNDESEPSELQYKQYGVTPHLSTGQNLLKKMLIRWLRTIFPFWYIYECLLDSEYTSEYFLY